MSALARCRLFAVVTTALFLLSFYLDLFKGSGVHLPAASSLPQQHGYSRFRFYHRKLLEVGTEGNTGTNHIGDECRIDDIVMHQGSGQPLPNGIPTYMVTVLNECTGEGCAISQIHLSCGWFSSARLINPRIFRRLRYNDCLVNDGRPLRGGLSVSFEYANSFPYRLAVSNATCLP